MAQKQVPKMAPIGIWKQRLTPAVCPSCSSLSTHPDLSFPGYQPVRNFCQDLCQEPGNLARETRLVVLALALFWRIWRGGPHLRGGLGTSKEEAFGSVGQVFGFRFFAGARGEAVDCPVIYGDLHLAILKESSSVLLATPGGFAKAGAVPRV